MAVKTSPRSRVGPAAPPPRRDPRRPSGTPSRRPAPAPHTWWADRLVEVLTGRRPIGSLAGRVQDAAFENLWKLVESRADWRRPQPRTEMTPHVHHCRYTAAGDDALEVTAVVALSRDRFRAVAFRLERGGARMPGSGAWRCTAVEAR